MELIAPAMPAGTVLPFAAATPAEGYLSCDGLAVSRQTYKKLFQVIGTSFGEGDGSTTFNVPDFRGRFLRGWDNGAGNDPDRGSRTAMATGGAAGDNVGSVQGDQFESHSHSFRFNTAHGSSGGRTYPSMSGTDNSISETRNTLTSGNSETRPKNANVNFIIKY